MTTKTNYECILLKTKDKRKFFTFKRNLNYLIEFTNFFKAEIEFVKLESGEVLDLEELASAISNPDYSADYGFDKLKNAKTIQIGSDLWKEDKKKKSRKERIRRAGIIRNHIRKEFEKGNKVELSKVKSRYKRYELSSACFSSHISTVKKQMEKQGFYIKKVGAGKYIKM